MISIQTPIITDHPWTSEGIILTRDGSKWLAVFNDFINLHVSPSGFGDTQEEAVNALKKTTMDTEEYVLKMLDGDLAAWQKARDGEKDPSVIKVNPRDFVLLKDAIRSLTANTTDQSGQLRFRGILIEEDKGVPSQEFHILE